MNKDRKILLIILFFSILGSLSAMNLIILSERRERALSNRELLEQQYIRLQSGGDQISPANIDEMRDIVKGEQSRFFSNEETDPYKLGLEILSMLEKQRINVIQYKTLEQDDGFLLEFSVTSRTSSLFAFWEDLYEIGKYYRIPYFSMKNEKTGISSTFRIGYAVYE